MTLRGRKTVDQITANRPGDAEEQQIQCHGDVIIARLQPNSLSRGWIKTDGDEPTPALINVVMKQSQTTNQP